MKVLVVCEDPTHDQHVVKPIVERAMEELGFTASVSVLDDPHLRGIAHLLAELPAIVADARMVQLLVVAIDNDCDRQRNRAKIENAATQDPRIVTCCAMEEVETWMLALHRETLGAPWPDVRAHCDVKEAFAVPFLVRNGLQSGPGRGRKAAMRALRGNWRPLLNACPELRTLMSDIQRSVQTTRGS